MANLVKIIKDGTETGATVADKINLGFDKADANEAASDGCVKADGTVAMTENLSLGNKNITNINSLRYGVADRINLNSFGTKISGGALYPLANDSVDLGLDTMYFKKGFIDAIHTRVDQTTTEPDAKQLVTKAWVNKPREAYELVGQNPNIKMKIETGGTAAVMEVVDLETGHLVATMEYDKFNSSFLLTLQTLQLE